MRSIALLVLCVPLHGCFTYVPTTSAPAQAARVRVHLSAPTDFKLLDFTANEIVLAEGEYVRSDSQVLVLSAMGLKGRSGTEFAGRGESLTIPKERIAAVHRQQLSPSRTLLLGGVLAVVATATSRVVGASGGSGGDGGRPPPGEH